MKFLDLVRPINTQKKLELETELEMEKLRLMQATDRAATEIRTSVIERRWFDEHPLETSLVILFGGFCLARWAGQQRKNPQNKNKSQPSSDLDLGGALR